MSEHKGSPAAEKEKVPGGRLFMQEVGKIMIAHYKSINEGPRVKLKKQLKLFRRFDLHPPNGYDWCRECGVINLIGNFYQCPTHTAPYCKGCLKGEEEKVCPQCVVSCDYDREDDDDPIKCKTLTDGNTCCEDCNGDLCVNHRQYCSHCGMVYCLQGIGSIAGMPIDCFDKHSCMQGRKRAKH